MKKILSLITGILLTIGLLAPNYIIFADDFKPADEEQNASNTYTLDADDTGGDITLQFGTTLSEYLQWNSANLRFDFSDDLRVAGDLETGGTNLTLDADNSGSGSNVSIIANQGTDSDGTLRYNATTNQWEISNDGGAFIAIGSGSGGSTLTIQDEGSNVTNTPHSTLNFVGSSVTVTDAGGGVATVTISGSGGSDEFENIYSNDADNTLTTSNGAFTINTGTNDFIVDSNDWTVDGSGNIVTLGNIVVSGTVDGVDVSAIGAQAHDQNTDTGSTTGIFTLDSDNTGAGANVDIIANQGTDSDGTLRYNATTNQWEISNDGGAFTAIATGTGSTDLPTAQARRTTTYTLTTTATDITLDTTDVENDTTVVEHDNTNTDRIYVYEDGIYLITYDATGGGTAGSTHLTYAQVRSNDTTVLPGSYTENRNYSGEYSSSSSTFLADLNANDYVSLQLWRDIITDATQNDITFSVAKMEGVKGDKGDQGLPGSAGTGTDSNTFTIDQDDTGGDVTLQFGTTLAEQFGWDNSLSALSTFDAQMSYRVIQSSTPPVTCSATVAGMQWMDTDTGIVYSCDTSNGRNKWLSINELALFGDESGSCDIGADPNTDADCNVDWGNGLGPDSATNLGMYIPQPITITGYGFSEDNDACTSGSFDLEIWSTGSNTDDNNYSLETTVASGLTGEAHNSNSLNADVTGNQYTIWGIDNNCLNSIDDWNMIIYFRYRHD